MRYARCMKEAGPRSSDDQDDCEIGDLYSVRPGES